MQRLVGLLPTAVNCANTSTSQKKSSRDTSDLGLKVSEFDEAAIGELVRPCRCVILLVSHLLPSSSAEEIRTVTLWFYSSFRAIIIALLRYKIEHIIFISSGGTIYSENYTGLPVTEDHPLNAQIAYGFGSWCLIV
jgi:nucleoside-diphosphate-sugar epimerase